MNDRVLLLVPVTSYKTTDFMEAAGRLGVDVVVGTDRRQSLEGQAPGHNITLELGRPGRTVETILGFAAERPLAGVVGVDDETTVLAAMAAGALGLPHNPVEAVRISRDKFRSREAFASAGLRGPRYDRHALGEGTAGLDRLAETAGYPCVLKPLCLSASRGVIRADTPTEFVEAWRRIESILNRGDLVEKGGDRAHLLVEGYLPGEEITVEGLLVGGEFRALAIFDKPDPLEGPAFEETLFITPSRHPEPLQASAVEEVRAGCRALGLREGPVHAELRLYDGEPTLLEIAPRTIGGLCSRALRFGAGIRLEELVLRHATGRATDDVERESRAAGVMMIPIPRAGVLREFGGLEAAREVAGIEEVTISRHAGAELVPLPEGNSYLGFVFARGESPREVESALRQSHDLLRFRID